MNNEKTYPEEKIWDYMYKQIAGILTKVGPRAPCSPEERKAADLLKAELNTLTSDVREESFTCHPRSFDSWPRFSAIFAVIALGIFLSAFGNVSILVSSSVALITVIFLFYCIYRQFFRYEEFIHHFAPFRKGTSQNIFGIFPAKNSPKKRVIFAGHIDSAFRFNLMHFTDVGYGYFIFGGVTILVVETVLFLFSILSEIIVMTWTGFWEFLYWVIVGVTIFVALILLVGGKSDKFFFGAMKHPSSTALKCILGTMFYDLVIQFSLYSWIMDQISPLKIGVVILLSGIPFMVALYFFLGRDAVPGAIDNLTAVGVCMGIAKYLKDLPKAEADKIFSEMEVVILLTGSEEAGDRGAEAFARAHATEYNQIDTTVVNMESLSDSAMQKIVTKELTTNTVCNPKIYNLLAECAKDLGINYKLQELPAIAGGTDCAGFFKGGLQVSGLEGIRYKDYLNWYHSDKDNLAIIHTEKRENSDSGTDYKTLNVRGAMVNCFKICVKYLEKLA